MASWTRIRLLGVALGVLLVGCDRAGGEESNAPRDLGASTDGCTFDTVHLTWTAPPRVETYEAESRVGSGEWTPLGSALPPNAVAADVILPSDSPELATLGFRLRAVVAGSATDWSNEATLARGIRPPSPITASTGTYASTATGPVTIAWTSTSSVATELQLERSELDAAGQPTTWSPIPGVTTGAQYVDHDLQDGKAYAYRVKVGAGGVWSPACGVASSDLIDLAAPWGLSAAKVEGGVQLTWTNQSTTADQATIVQYTRDWPNASTFYDLTTVPSAFLDARLPWPVWNYQVEVERPATYLYAYSEIAQIAPYTLPGPPALAASGLRLPPGQWAARDEAGRFHLADQIDGPRVHRATATGHDTHALSDGAIIANPGVLLDAQGNPHTVFVEQPSWVTPADIVHEWWDGSAWQSEVVAADTVTPTTSSGPQLWFGLDGTGSVQVLYRRYRAIPPDELVHVARVDGAWSSAVLATPSVSDFVWYGDESLAVGPDGTAYVALSGNSVSLASNVYVLCTRAPAGTWSDEAVPTGSASDSGPVWLAGGNAGDVAMALLRPRVSPTEAIVVRRSGGVWAAPEAVPASGALTLASSADFARLALSAPSGSGTDVHARGASGWDDLTVGPTGVVAAMVGFDASGRLWALFSHDCAPAGCGPETTSIPYSLFDENP